MLQVCACIESAFNSTGPDRVTPSADALSPFRRYKSQTKRMYRYAVEDLERLRSLRAGPPV